MVDISNNSFFNQLRDTCSITAAVWVALIEQGEVSWKLYWSHGIKNSSVNRLQQYFEGPNAAGLLKQAGDSDRIRWRKLNPLGKEMDCDRLYLFPNVDAKKSIVVGADLLQPQEKGFFKALSLGLHSNDIFNLSSIDKDSTTHNKNRSDDFSHEPDKTFSNILYSLSSYLPCDAAYLAVRFGDKFQVEALQGISSRKLGTQIAIQDNQALAALVESRRGILLASKDPSGNIRLIKRKKNSASNWLVVPLLIGNRVTGLTAFEGKSFDHSDLERATILARHIAPVVERTMIFQEASHHLQNIALLNELASVVSVGLDFKEVTQRVHRMLQRAFPKGLAELLLVSAEGRMLTSAGGNGALHGQREYSVSSTYVGLCVEKGKPVRSGSVDKEPRYTAINPDTRSKLAVPLIFRENVIGVLALESSEPDAFSKLEEKFLLLIASQITALVESARLNEQTLQRADRLAMINELVQQVVGQTDQAQIAQRAAALMEKRSGFEMVVIGYNI